MNDATLLLPTVGILYPGEMGAAIGKLLVEQHVPVVTTLEARGERTRRHCTEARLETLRTFSEVVRVADIVISLVPPSAAVDVASQFCAVATPSSRRPLFVDANSISPATAVRVGQLLARSQLPFVDASIHGLASRLCTDGTLYLSGPNAHTVAMLFGRSLKTRVLGDSPGKASEMKMMMGGMSKGLVALFLEMSLVAYEAGLLDEILEGYREYYPGVMTAVERLLPTYPRHACRRADELKELENTIVSLGLKPAMLRAARQTIAAVGAMGWCDLAPDSGSAAWSVPEIVENVSQHNPLRPLQMS